MKSKKAEWEFKILDRSVDRKKFDCRVEALNNYIRNLAGQDIKRDLTRTFVATTKSDPKHVAGYYSLCMAQIAFETLPDKQKRKISSNYPVPTARIARLAVDKEYQGRGLGTLLLMDAFNRIISATQLVAANVIIVDAKNDAAAAFYEKYGFIRLKGKSRTLFIPLKTILLTQS